MLLVITTAQAFAPTVSTITFRPTNPSVRPSATASSTATVSTSLLPTTSRLHAFVADRPTEKGGEEKKRRRKDGKNNSFNDDDDNDDDDKSWIPSKNGGFIPNLASSTIRILRGPLHHHPSDDLRQQVVNNDNDKIVNTNTFVKSAAKTDNIESIPTTEAPPEPLRIWTVNDIHKYKEVVADEDTKIVVVRFYAPWCRACRAIQAPFRRLPKQFPPSQVKFVEVPVTKDNAYLHRGLGVPSLPYGHIYHPTAGLVEELKISKNHFANFKSILGDYVNGQCQIQYNDDGTTNRSATAVSTASSTITE
jgi:thiol-disulfide isomerase/thioredoxin